MTARRTILEQVRADAHAAALSALVALHQAEYDELVMDELAKRGVFPHRRPGASRPVRRETF